MIYICISDSCVHNYARYQMQPPWYHSSQQVISKEKHLCTHKTKHLNPLTEIINNINRLFTMQFAGKH